MFDDVEPEIDSENPSLLASLLFALACLLGLTVVSFLPMPKGLTHVR